jgi:hypothetical protein
MGLANDIVESWVSNTINQFNPRLVGTPKNGVRKTSGYLTSPQDSAHGNASSSSNSTSTPDIEVPEHLYSTPVLEWIGFDFKTSKHFLWTWTNNDNMSFEDVVPGWLRENCEWGPKDWRASMKELEISEER